MATVKYLSDNMQTGETFNVDISARTCTCEWPAQTGVTCRHRLFVAERRKVEIYNPNYFPPAALTDHWVRICRQQSLLGGQYPTDTQIRAEICALTDAQSPTPWLTEDPKYSESKQRFASTGDTSSGGGMTRKRRLKSEKRACKYCVKAVSGFTRHPPTACLAYKMRC